MESPRFDASRKQKALYAVGQVVDVSKRTEVGMCQPGGVARIISALVDRSGAEHYDVLYVLDGRKEKELPSSILKEHTDYAGRSRRSLDIATAG